MPPTGLTDRVFKAGKAMHNGWAEYDENMLKVRRPYYHRRDLSDTTNTLTFFNAAEEDDVSNLPGGGNGLPNDYYYIVDSIGIRITQGYSVNGTAVTNSEPYQADLDPASIAADMKALLEHGRFKLTVGDAVVVDKVFGLTKFPQGGGVEMDVTLESDIAAAATLIGLVNVRNGQALNGNNHTLRPWFSVFPGRPIRGTINWNFDRTLTVNLVVEVTLDGMLTVPQNN